ncbi:MAG TPA: hypothetical protein VGM18_01080 [Candidatus Sulfotelmatobacter sp.]|jgi:hypothetical protein
MKKPLVVIFVVVLLALVSGRILVLRYEARRAAAARIEAERDARYQAKLAEFQRDLPRGSRRAEVGKYLGTRGTPYSDQMWNPRVKIDEYPGDGLACDRWSVYVEFRFNHTNRQVDPSPYDTLSDVSIQSIGHCL